MYEHRLGPLVTSWCMRMEAKNSYFKKSARSANFKNIAYSVASRHQKLACAYLQCSKFFIYMTGFEKTRLPHTSNFSCLM